MTLELTPDEKDAAREALGFLFRYYRNALMRCEIGRKKGTINAVIFAQYEKACTRKTTAAVSLADKLGVKIEP